MGIIDTDIKKIKILFDLEHRKYRVLKILQILKFKNKWI